MNRPALLESRPRLRPLEAIPIEHEGAEHIGLRDRTGLVPQVLLISSETLYLLSHFDGRHSVREAAHRLSEQFGFVPTEEDLTRLVESLDEALFLESPRFAAWMETERQEYLEQPARPAICAGGAYAAAPDLLALQLDGILARSGAVREVLPAPRGVVAPHIDYARGGACYASLYGALRDAATARTFVVLGTNHFGHDAFYTATRKPFETPLGTVEVDEEALDRLAAASREDLFEYEHDHAREHSIELQAVWLAHLFGAANVRVVPVLCGGFEQLNHDRQRPEGCEPVQAMVGALRQLLADRPGQVCLIAAADLAHFGQNFGDREPLSNAWQQRVEARDREILRTAAAGDAGGFYGCLYADDNHNRICSAANLYAVVAAVGGAGRLLRYHLAADAESQCAVSCAALWFE